MQLTSILVLYLLLAKRQQGRKNKVITTILGTNAYTGIPTTNVSSLLNASAVENSQQ